MSTVGETLRRERLRTGLDLEKIAQDTKISVRTLELIETNQFEKLPGGVFARSFVRQYARAVGLDAEETVAELEQMLAPKPEPDAGVHNVSWEPEIRMPPAPRWGGSSRFRSGSAWPALGLVVLVMLACSGAYTVWQTSRKAPVAPAEAAETTQVKPAAETPATTVRNPSPETGTPAGAAARTAPQQAVSGMITADNSTGALHIALTAEEETWVRATSNGKVVFSGIIQPNETKALSAGDTVTLRLGNAGGVSINLNGKAIPAVGPKGQVRTVQLSPDGAVQVAPPPKPQPPQPAEEKTQTL
jgi:cytoskeleton protein RodZ